MTNYKKTQRIELKGDKPVSFKVHGRNTPITLTSDNPLYIPAKGDTISSYKLTPAGTFERDDDRQLIPVLVPIAEYFARDGSRVRTVDHFEPLEPLETDKEEEVASHKSGFTAQYSSEKGKHSSKKEHEGKGA